jgi:hypothetical protein
MEVLQKKMSEDVPFDIMGENATMPMQQSSEIQPVVSAPAQNSTLNSKLADYKSTLKSWFDSLSEEQRDLLVPLKFLLEDYEEYIKKNPSSTVQNFIELLKKNYCIN